MIYALVTLALGLATTLYGLAVERLRRRMASWPVARGRILEKKVGPSQGPAPGPPAYSFEATVRYEYEVGGRAYTGTHIHLGRFVHTRENAEKLLASIAETPDVRYDPAQPETAYLLPPPVSWSWLLLVVGPLLLLGGSAALVVVLAR